MKKTMKMKPQTHMETTVPKLEKCEADILLHLPNIISGSETQISMYVNAIASINRKYPGIIPAISEMLNLYSTTYNMVLAKTMTREYMNNLNMFYNDLRSTYGDEAIRVVNTLTSEVAKKAIKDWDRENQ